MDFENIGNSLYIKCNGENNIEEKYVKKGRKLFIPIASKFERTVKTT